jgi:hypothetical protein
LESKLLTVKMGEQIWLQYRKARECVWEFQCPMTMMKPTDLTALDEPHFTQTELAMTKSKVEMYDCFTNKRLQNRAKQCRISFWTLATVSALLLSPLANVVNGEVSSLHLGPGSADAALERLGYCNSLRNEQEVAECFRDMTAMLMNENTAMASTTVQLQSPAEIGAVPFNGQRPLLEPMNVDDGVYLQDPPHCLSRFCQAPHPLPAQSVPVLRFPLCSFLPSSSFFLRVLALRFFFLALPYI